MKRSLLVALLVGSVGLSRAQSDEEPDDAPQASEPRGGGSINFVPRPLGSQGRSRATPGSPKSDTPVEDRVGARNADDDDSAPKSGGLRWRVYERLGAVPRPSSYRASHGYGDLNPGEGIAVGFTSAPSGRNGRCGISPSPAVSAGPEGCQWNAWISAQPGGSPLSPACALSGGFVMGVHVEWMSVPHNYGPRFCDLQPSSRYYCNVTGCRGLIHSPLGVEDYSRAEALAITVGKSCNMPGTTAVGAFDANGVCRCKDDLCEQIIRVFDTLARCTNHVMRHPNGTCYSCASAYPARCGAPNTVVENCALACRP